MRDRRAKLRHPTTREETTTVADSTLRQERAGVFVRMVWRVCWRGNSCCCWCRARYICDLLRSSWRLTQNERCAYHIIMLGCVCPRFSIFGLGHSHVDIIPESTTFNIHNNMHSLVYKHSTEIDSRLDNVQRKTPHQPKKKLNATTHHQPPFGRLVFLSHSCMHACCCVCPRFSAGRSAFLGLFRASLLSTHQKQRSTAVLDTTIIIV